MEKLIALLNKFIKEKKHYHWTFEDENDVSKYECLIIFKQFGFIKWLVQKEKINFDKVMKMGRPCFVWYDKGEIICVHDVDFDRQLIMLLSISDSPVEDLIYYLK